MIKLFMLFWLHYVGDFPLQGSFLGVEKSNYDYLLFVHCLIWTGTVCIGLEYFNMFEWWKLYFLFAGHFVVDRWKCRHPDRNERGLTKLLWVDQALHALQILIVYQF